MRRRRLLAYIALLGMLLLLCLPVYGYIRWTSPRYWAEFTDSSGDIKIRLLSRCALFTGSQWDLKVEAYEGRILMAAATILKNGDSPWDFPEIREAKFDQKTNEFTVLFHARDKVTKIVVKLELGEFRLHNYVEKGAAVEELVEAEARSSP